MKCLNNIRTCGTPSYVKYELIILCGIQSIAVAIHLTLYLKSLFSCHQPCKHSDVRHLSVRLELAFKCSRTPTLHIIINVPTSAVLLFFSHPAERFIPHTQNVLFFFFFSSKLVEVRGVKMSNVVNGRRAPPPPLFSPFSFASSRLVLVLPCFPFL